ncbi:MAG TPA: acyl-phosphate glycerol 3-phosphate acyltransferase [Rhodospirillaceae bacterium]|nr:acyl-phosphate glycerol 3-phosphate acyltransferase [Rhodospirillaceae bacterium]
MLTYIVPALAYLLGSIPFGLLLTKLAGAGDIRAIGSGNIGATNVLRTGKKGLAAATLLLDMLKGTAAVILAQHYAPEVANIAALAVLLGHMFPVWLKFKGGKGVATAFGIMLALSWPVALMAALTWLASAILLRISSASALIALASAPVYLIIFGQFELVLLSVLILVLVYSKHYANIIRLVKGTEPHIGQ